MKYIPSWFAFSIDLIVHIYGYEYNRHVVQSYTQECVRGCHLVDGIDFLNCRHVGCILWRFWRDFLIFWGFEFGNWGKGLFYFFGIGGTNPAPFDLPKSPSGIPRRSCTKNAGQNGTSYPKTIKKAPRPYGPGAPLYCLKMAHHAKNNDKRRDQQKQYNQHIKHPLQL